MTNLKTTIIIFILTLVSLTVLDMRVSAVNYNDFIHIDLDENNKQSHSPSEYNNSDSLFDYKDPAANRRKETNSNKVITNTTAPDNPDDTNSISNGGNLEDIKGYFLLPVKGGTFTSAYGPRSCSYCYGNYHWGIDLVSNESSKAIYASHDGIVDRVSRGSNGNYGNYIRIKGTMGGKNIRTAYAHLSSISVAVGQKVKKGEKIGVEGRTGCGACGVHLHFEIQIQDDTNRTLARQEFASHNIDYFKATSSKRDNWWINGNDGYTLLNPSKYLEELGQNARPRIYVKNRIER